MTPVSEWLWNAPALREALHDILPSVERFTTEFDRFEYLRCLIGWDVLGLNHIGRVYPGCFLWRSGSSSPDHRVESVDLAADIEAHGENLPLLRAGAFGGSLERLIDVKADYDARIARIGY